MDQQDPIRRRAAERSLWPVRRFALGEEPAELLSGTSATERIAMMWPLALEAWRLAGLPVPDLDRRNLPIRVVRRPTE